MKIKFKFGPNAGRVQSIPNDSPAIDLLLASGVVEEIKPGTLGEDRAPAGYYDTAPPFAVKEVWLVKTPPNSDVPHVLRHYCSEFSWFKEPPKGCPAEVIEAFKTAMKKYWDTKAANQQERNRAQGSLKAQTV